jgi:hypothetical protein
MNQPMDLELVKWLNMVWGALEEQDSDKRSDLLSDAHCFLEQTRIFAPETAEMKTQETVSTS